MPPLQVISSACSPAGMSFANRRTATCAASSRRTFSSVLEPSTVAAAICSSTAWSTISRDDFAVVIAMRSQPADVHVSRSRSKRSS